MGRSPFLVLLFVLWGGATAERSAFAQAVEVPNPSFESGRAEPDGWSFSGKKGAWLRTGGDDGRCAIAVTGDGGDSSRWQSAPIPLAPSAPYELRFRARRIDGSGGTPTAGPIFCNRDLGGIDGEWRSVVSVFQTPSSLEPEEARLCFGQWMTTGTIAYDAVELYRVQPVYRIAGDIVLGEGERTSGASYEFHAPFSSTSRNHSRPLHSHRCAFNTHRWVFGHGSEVVYRHDVGGRRQVRAWVEVSITWYVAGELLVEAAGSVEDWRLLGPASGLGTRKYVLPDDLLPAAEVRIRLRPREEKASAPAPSFQVGEYRYGAVLDAPVPRLQGRTRFVSILETDPRLSVSILDLGDVLPGGRNEVVARIENTTARAIRLRPDFRVAGNDGQEVSRPAAIDAPAGAQTVRVPFLVPDAGAWTFRLTLGDGSRFRAELAETVPELHRTSYGESLPGATGSTALWWAPSGWKVSRFRPPPRAEGRALRIRTARNEVEAAQLVIRPARDLHGFAAVAADLTGPDGAILPAAAVEILRVGYVPVTQPTDAAGAVGDWPDPLPPLDRPIDLPADRNQPLWVRVRAPRSAPAGRYRGTIRLTAEEFSADVPIEVEVYGFTLPDRMTCATAFGFSPAQVWRYQGLKTIEDRRAVLDLYWRSFSAHHISPYDPAPLDGFRVRWPGASDWHGGVRDEQQPYSGGFSLRVVDDSETAQTAATHAQPVTIPPAGLRLRFRYRTGVSGHRFIVTLAHNDAGGAWMSGRNNDMEVEGTGGWQDFERVVTDFPQGAVSVTLRLWAARWDEGGATTGTVWFDDVTLRDAATGEELARGDFEPTSAGALRPEIDWSAWDVAMGRAIDEFHFNTFRLPIEGLGGGSYHSRTEPNLLGHAGGTPEYQVVFGAYARELQEHLRARGWLDEAFVYWFDEPDRKDYEFVRNGFRSLRDAAPDLRRMLTEQVEEELIGGPNLWCPVSHAYHPEPARKRRRAGESHWWYLCTAPKAPYATLFIDHPATELRVWLWQTWQRGIEGILVWETNYWTSEAAYADPERPQNPWDDPMSWESGDGRAAGRRSPWGNGDGRFLYPPEGAADGRPAAPVLAGPVESIRWEMLRDGIEDYEYLTILRALLDERGTRLPEEERLRYRALLKVPRAIAASMTRFTRTPDPIDRHRDAVARAIEAMSLR